MKNIEQYTMKESSFKEGIELLKQSTLSIKSDFKFFLKMVLFMSVFYFALQFMNILSYGREDTFSFVSNLIFYFCNLLLIPSLLINVFRSKEYNSGFGETINRTFTKINSFKIVGIITLTFSAICLSFIISAFPLLNAIGGHDINVIVETFTVLSQHSNDPVFLEQFISNNPNSAAFLQSLGSINKGLLFACFVLGALLFVFSMVILFYTFFAVIYFDNIRLKEALSLATRLNLKNTGFFFAASLGIVIVLFLSSLLQFIPLLNYMTHAFFYIYVYYIFTEMTKALIVTKKMKLNENA